MAKIIREEVIGVHQVPDNPIRCPKCNGGNLVLKGTIQRDYEETWVNGVTVSNIVNEDPEWVHEVDAIECNDCMIRYHVQTETTYNLTKVNGELRTALARATGMGKPC